ncbi:MAG: CoA transferase [Pseudomonadota bacterium]
MTSSVIQNGPIQGTKVLELSHVMAGPTCARILADLGAEVIKLERLEGEDSRRMAPPWQGDEAAGFLMLNRNKRGLAVNLKDGRGKEIVRRLVRDCDIVVENFRKGTLDRLELGYEELSRINPGLIFCEISGYGRTGPYADKGGFDVVAQAMAGVLSVTGEQEGRPPVKAGVPVADIGAGMYGVIGILAALIRRRETGRGQRVDTSLLEAAASFMTWPAASYYADGSIAKPMGTAHPLDAPYQAFQASDGWFIVGAANQANWLRMVTVIGAEHLAEDPRFLENPDRVENLQELVSALSEIFLEKTKAEWIELLDSAGVPTGPINSIEEMLNNPQIIDRGMVRTVKHSTLGSIKTLGLPIRFSQTPSEFERGAPTLGEHTNEILSDIGYSSSELEALVEHGVVVAFDH